MSTNDKKSSSSVIEGDLESTLEDLQIDETSANFAISAATTDARESEDDFDSPSLEPVDPWTDNEGAEAEADLFTEEELINVLRSFEDENNPSASVHSTDSDNLVEFPTGEALPELQFEVDDSLLLPPAEFTASIFDVPGDIDVEIDDKNSNQGEIDNLKQQEDFLEGALAAAVVDDEKKVEAGGDELDLLEGLQKLNLGPPEDIPPYLYCQPCTPGAGSEEPTQFSLASIAEDTVLMDPRAQVFFKQLEKERTKLPQKEFDTLLQLSLLSVNDDENNPYLTEAEMDALFENYNQPTTAETMEETEATMAQPGQQQQQQQVSEEQHNVSRRPEALEEAAKIIGKFIASDSGPRNERTCLGHKETIYGANFSRNGKYLATASQDSTVRIWDVAKNALLSTLEGHSTDHECLRVAWASADWANDHLDRCNESQYAYLLATAGADGIVKVWATKDPNQKDGWTCCATLDHAAFERVPSNSNDEAEKPQVYAVQWIDHWRGLPGDNITQNSFLLTSSDDFVHLWEIDGNNNGIVELELNGNQDNILAPDLKFREVLSLNFTDFQNPGYGVSLCQVTDEGILAANNNNNQSNFLQGKAKASAAATGSGVKPFGGDRNPNCKIFVFDADYCPANGLLGVAASDGSLRLINGRGVCISIMQLPGCQSHLTSFGWDSTGTRLATCVATGHVIVWHIEVNENTGSLNTTCTAILEGGHELGRPVFGSRFFANGENLLLTWGVDGRMCCWDSFSQGNIHAPIATLVSKTDYPIYAVDTQPSCIAVGGGGGEASFLGVPAYIFDL